MDFQKGEGDQDMKPKPLNLEEWLKKVNWSWDKDCLGEEKQIFVSETAFDDLKQRIKSACEFYQRYENDPKLLVKEHYHLLKKMEDDDIWAFTLLLTAPDLEIKINEYNKWLFKLAFRDVFEK